MTKNERSSYLEVLFVCEGGEKAHSSSVVLEYANCVSVQLRPIKTAMNKRSLERTVGFSNVSSPKRTNHSVMNFSMTQEDAADNVTWIDSPDAGNKDSFDIAEDVDKPSSQLSLFTLKGAKKKSKKPVRPPPKEKITENATQLKMLLESSQRTTPDIAEIAAPRTETMDLYTVPAVSSSSIPTVSSIVEVSSSIVDDFPEISEQDLQRIDMEVASQLNMANVDPHALPKVTMPTEPSPVQVPVVASEPVFSQPLPCGTQSSYETVEMSDDFMRALEEMEQAAIAASQSTAVPVHAVADAIPVAPVVQAPTIGNPYANPYAKPHATPAPAPAVPVVPTVRPVYQQDPISTGSRGITTSSSSSVSAGSSFVSKPNSRSGPSSLISSTLVVCVRLFAVDITDDTYRRVKTVRCYQADAGKSNLVPDGSSIFTVELFDEWYECSVAAGDIFHAVNLGDLNSYSPHSASQFSLPGCSIFKSPNRIVINNTFGILVMHPDVLISPTKVAESCSCIRRGVISDKVRSFGGSSAAAVGGNLKHAFIEMLTERLLDAFAALPATAQKPTPIAARCLISQQEINSMMQSCKEQYLEELFLHGNTDEDVFMDLAGMIEPVTEWVYKAFYAGVKSLDDANDTKRTDSVGNGNGSAGNGGGTSGYPNQMYRSATVSGASLTKTVDDYFVNALHSAEEVIHSPVLGIKGQIDMVARAKFKSAKTTPSSGGGAGLVDVWLPIEFKTGKWRPSTVIGHRAQVILYILTLMVRERSGFQTQFRVPNHGAILYINEFSTTVDFINPSWMDIRALMVSRNILAQHIKISSNPHARSLPPLLQRLNECQYCYQAAECLTYHAAVEKGSQASSGVPDLFRFILNDVSPSQLQYLQHWDRLLELESIATEVDRASNWVVNSREKEASGDKSLSEVRVVNHFAGANADNAHEYVLVFAKQTASASDDLETVFSVGDKVYVSIESSEKFLSQRLASLDLLDDRSGSSCSSMTTSETMTTTLGDIEDLGLKLKGSSRSVMRTEANVASGSVIAVSMTEITLSFAAKPKRILQVCDDDKLKSSWSLRLDKDEIAITISTMRTSLLSLFVQPHNPNVFMERAKVADPAFAARAGYIARLRGLIVDLKAPTFRSLAEVGSVSDIYMLAPAQVDRDTYKHALKLLNNHLQGCPEVNPPDSITVGAGGELIITGGVVIYPGCNPFKLFNELRHLNKGQKDAIQKMIQAQDYALLLGLPGTGKTSTLALGIRILIAKGLRVLLTSFTHSAVDNLLSKLMESGVSKVQVARLGTLSSVHNSVKDFVLDPKSLKHIDTLAAKVAGTRLVACTALTAARHVLMKQFNVDYCIVDEAGQITQPNTIGAILTSQRFVLVGDDHQLPPLVVSQEAQAEGMDVSLFKRLIEAHPEAVSTLNMQYRMNEEIMLVCNTLIYEHRMACASESVAKAKLFVQHSQLPLPSYGGVGGSQRTDWLHRCLQPSSSVVFLNTDMICNCQELKGHPEPRTAFDARKGKSAMFHSVTNHHEVSVVRQIMMGLISMKYDLKHVGVISVFRAQVELLQKTLLPLLQQAGCGECDISTVDKFQGRDMPVIVVSTVKSASDGLESIGNLLKDWRRINVAVTRAKVKLIVIGSVAVMQQVPVLSSLTQLCNERDWVVDLPPNAADMYFSSSASSGSAGIVTGAAGAANGRTVTPRKVTKVSVQSEVKSTITSGTIVELGGRTWLPHGLAGI